MRSGALALALCSPLTPPSAAQSPLWAGLTPGPFAVGFRILDTVDVARTFVTADDRAAARPVRLYIWYPARAGTGTGLTVRTLAAEAWMNGGVMRPVDGPSFSRAIVRARAGAAFSQISDRTADSLLDTPLYARLEAVPRGSNLPVVLIAPGQPLAMPVSAEYLASNGFVVISPARKAERSSESLEFTPNASSIETEADDLAFALAVARGRRDIDAARLGLLAYSSSGISSLAFTFRSRAPRAVAVFEGWEGWEAGQELVRALRGYDPRAFRAAYLLLGKSAEESGPDFRKTTAFFDTMKYAPRWRISFDSAAHTDFASLGVALRSAPSAMRRNFTRANELLRDFMITELGAGVSTPTPWNVPGTTSWMRVESFVAHERVPTNDEFFHLAERDPAAADTLALRLQRSGVTPFTEASLSRLAFLAAARRPQAAASLYGIVVRAFPRSLSALVAWSDALAAAGQNAAAKNAAVRALSLATGDSTLSEQRRSELLKRLTLRVAPPPPTSRFRFQ